MYMYAAEQIYVMPYLEFSFGMVQRRVGRRTIRTSINYAYYRRRQP